MPSQEVLMFLENKPEQFQESFYTVFGKEVRDVYDIINLSKDFSTLKWEKVNNGRVLLKKEIYEVRGRSSLIKGEEISSHHWPPRSRRGRLKIETPDEFHLRWHRTLENLYLEEEFEIFWKELFSSESFVLCDVVDYTIKKAKRVIINKKKD